MFVIKFKKIILDVTLACTTVLQNMSQERGIFKNTILQNKNVTKQFNTKGMIPTIPEGIVLSKKRQIKLKRKLYEFFVAPITTFWSET